MKSVEYVAARARTNMERPLSRQAPIAASVVRPRVRRDALTWSVFTSCLSTQPARSQVRRRPTRREGPWRDPLGRLVSLAGNMRPARHR